jgi:hypothetical protein
MYEKRGRHENRVVLKPVSRHTDSKKNMSIRKTILWAKGKDIENKTKICFK